MEPFVYLALFLLVALTALLFRWLKAQIEEPAAERHEAAPWASPHRPATVISATTPATTGVAARPSRPTHPSPPAPLPRRPPARLAAASSVRDLRRGIMWMTILGRCRGLEPPRRIADTGTPHAGPSS